jgi:hypothetical protein
MSLPEIDKGRNYSWNRKFAGFDSEFVAVLADRRAGDRADGGDAGAGVEQAAAA